MTCLLNVVCCDPMAHEFNLCLISGNQWLQRFRVMRLMDGWIPGKILRKHEKGIHFGWLFVRIAVWYGMVCMWLFAQCMAC